MDIQDTAHGSRSWDILVQNFAEKVDILEPSVLYNHIEQLRAALHQEGVDLAATRQHLTPEEMTAINRVLYFVKVQLLEGEAGMEIVPTICTDEECASDETLFKAGFLFCWLLSTNINISCVDLVHTTLLRRLPSVLKIGLPLNFTVRKIKLDFWCSDIGKEDICIAQGLHAGLPLEVYHCHGTDFSDQSAAQISDVLRQCRSTLKDVSLTSGPVSGPNQKNIKVILEALLGSPKLSSLYLCGYDLGKEGGEILAQILRTCHSLRKLSIQCPDDEAIDFLLAGLSENSSLHELALWNNHDSSGRVAFAVADLLKRNHSIKSLSLSQMNIDNDGGRALAEVLLENVTLKDLNLEMNKIGSDGGAAFVDAISMNNTLETLNLGGNDIDSHVTHALMAASQENKSIRCLELDPRDENPLPDIVYRMQYRLDNNGLQALAKALHDQVVVEKLHLKWESDCSSLYVGQLFRAIEFNNSVKELEINTADSIDLYAARLLSHVFATSTTLRKVFFAYEFDHPEVVMTLLAGLSRNKSIREANFGCFCYDTPPEILKNLFVANSTLRSFHMYCYLRGDRMVTILEGLAENYTLTHLNLGSLAEPGYELFQAQEIIRRNQRLLRLAVQFVVSTRQDDEARSAFRKLGSSASLVEEIMKEQNLSKDAARELVQAASAS